MTEKKRKKLLKYVVEFVKLQLTGNILFWGTYGGYFALHELMEVGEVAALATASIFAHVLFFVVNKEWVFDDKTGKRKTSQEVTRFVMFMGLNYFINLGIITGLSHYFGISPYIGQFIAGFFFTAWNFIGLRFWVFQEIQHHALSTKYVKQGKKRRAKARVKQSAAKRRVTRRTPQQKTA